MEIYKLICEERDLSLKAKKLRENGYIPANVYGNNMDAKSLQVSQKEVAKFLKSHSIGSQVLLDMAGEEQLAIFKDSQRDPLSYKIIHMDYQALTSGEKVKLSVPIIYLNKDSVGRDEVLQEQMSEIEISTLPKYLVDQVEVDVSKYSLGDTVLVSDLDISSNENIEVLSPADSQVCVITHGSKLVEETPEDEEDAAEVPVVSEEETAAAEE